MTPVQKTQTGMMKISLYQNELFHPFREWTELKRERDVGMREVVGTYSFTEASFPREFVVHSSRVRTHGRTSGICSSLFPKTCQSRPIVPSSFTLANSPGFNKHSLGKFTVIAESTFHIHSPFLSWSLR